MSGDPAVIVAGDALIDLTPTTTATGALAYEPHPGGSCLNVAVGLGRLGVPVALLARVSGDGWGHLLRAHLADSGVGQDLLVATDDLTTPAAVHVIDGQPGYSFHAERGADRGLSADDLGELPAGAALHVGSIALVLEPAATTLEGLLRRETGRRLLSLDPNVRPSLISDAAAYLERLEGWIRLVDVVKVSSEDLAWLLPHSDEDDVVDDWLGAGAALVVVTRGADGARASTRRATAVVAAPRVEVADTVGAGDSFTAAMLAHLHARGSLGRAAVERLDAAALTALLTEAVAIAADTCTRPGCDPPRRAPG